MEIPMPLQWKRAGSGYIATSDKKNHVWAAIPHAYLPRIWHALFAERLSETSDTLVKYSVVGTGPYKDADAAKQTCEWLATHINTDDIELEDITMQFDA